MAKFNPTRLVEALRHLSGAQPGARGRPATPVAPQGVGNDGIAGHLADLPQGAQAQMFVEAASPPTSVKQILQRNNLPVPDALSGEFVEEWD